jgi:predicted dinucleotide-binding enzyme
MKKLEPQPILDLLDDFNHAREVLVQGLKKLGFSDEQAYAKIMKHQCESQRIYRAFKDVGFNELEHAHFLKDREDR